MTARHVQIEQNEIDIPSLVECLTSGIECIGFDNLDVITEGMCVLDSVSKPLASSIFRGKKWDQAKVRC